MRDFAEQAAGHLDPAHIGQLQVEHHHSGRAAAADAERLLAVADGGDHVEPSLGEVAGNGVPPHRVVVDDHHPYPWLAHGEPYEDWRGAAGAV